MSPGLGVRLRRRRRAARPPVRVDGFLRPPLAAPPSGDVAPAVPVPTPPSGSAPSGSAPSGGAEPPVPAVPDVPPVDAPAALRTAADRPPVVEPPPVPWSPRVVLRLRDGSEHELAPGCPERARLLALAAALTPRHARRG